jgi:hypothetical protein
MHIPATIRTSFGPRAIGLRPTIRVTITACEAYTLALAIERKAADAERDGAFATAERLRRRAAMLRDAAR